LFSVTLTGSRITRAAWRQAICVPQSGMMGVRKTWQHKVGRSRRWLLPTG